MRAVPLLEPMAVPSGERSTMATWTPCFAAASAATAPTIPPPITRTSTSFGSSLRDGGMLVYDRTVRMYSSPPALAELAAEEVASPTPGGRTPDNARRLLLLQTT